MAENKDSRLTVTPLFNKMDAFLARHRGQVAEDIPVLTAETLAPPSPAIPVLSETVADAGLMFDPTEFYSAQSPFVPPLTNMVSPPPPEKITPLYLDLPLLDLDDMLPESALTQPAHVDSDIPGAALPDAAPVMPEIPLLDLTAAVAEAETIEITVTAPAEDQELTLSEVPVDHAVQLTLEHEETAPSVAAQLSESAIAEITASVAAQIAVEVSTEVAQLTRQHFASLMNSFYGDSLRKLTEEISRDMENHLAPRVTELVHAELKRQGLAS